MRNWGWYKKSLRVLITWLEKFSPYYLSLTARIKFFDGGQLQKYTVFDQYAGEFAIVMQGQVVTKDNFTLETLKLYRHVYPNIHIILSTWEIRDVVFLSVLSDLGITVIQNPKPTFAGLFNVNLQIVSTTGGLDFAERENVQYVLKNRTDQRCSKPVDFIGYMLFLQHQFPLNNAVPITKRLIIISINTFFKRLYGVSDMFMFGALQDMRKYWVLPLDSNKIPAKDTSPEYFIQRNHAEGYFVNHFFKTIGHQPEWTVKDSNSFFASYFGIVDKEQFDLFWFKYDRFFDSIIDQEAVTYNFWKRKELTDWSKLV